jgi:hypothetical protein
LVTLNHHQAIYNAQYWYIQRTLEDPILFTNCIHITDHSVLWMYEYCVLYLVWRWFSWTETCCRIFNIAYQYMFCHWLNKLMQVALFRILTPFPISCKSKLIWEEWKFVPCCEHETWNIMKYANWLAIFLLVLTCIYENVHKQICTSFYITMYIITQLCFTFSQTPHTFCCTNNSVC